MDRIIYEGKEYIRRRDKWSHNNEIVIDTLQRKLTKLYDLEHPVVQKKAPNTKRTAQRNRNPQEVGHNYAIKCNFCDGGADDTRIGFAGLCSDAVREANTKRSKEIWCGNEQNPCRMFVEGRLSREELVRRYTEDRIKNGTLGFCNEVKILSEWRVGAGSNTRKGVMQGTRRTIPNAQPGHLCVLTTRDPFSSKEEDRYIFGAFIIEKAFDGDEYTEGQLFGDLSLAISFNASEAHQLLYYKYKQWDKNKKLVWGTGIYRLLTDKEAVAMLDAFIAVKETQEGKAQAQKIKDYFLKHHPVN